MDDEFTLHAGEVGAYKWGSLLVRFAPLTKVSPRAVVEIIAGAIAGNATWSNVAEFRGYIAVLHEIVHYFQDAYTSIGLWDYLVKRKYMPKLLADARKESWMDGSVPPYQAEARSYFDPLTLQYKDLGFNQASLQEMLTQLLYPSSASTSNHASENLLNYLRSQPPPRPFEPGDERPYTIQRLLEAEAAASVWLQISDLKMTGEQREIAQDHAAMHDLVNMPEIYSETLLEVLFVMNHLFGDASEGNQSTWNQFKVSFSMCLTVLLVDLACAYPAPDQLLSSDMQKDYDPGIRFIRLLNAFQTLAGKKTINDFVIAVQDSDFEQAESYLLQECEFPYPRAVDIYKSWVAYSEKMEGSGDSVFTFRKNCLTHRANDFSTYVYKRPSLTIEKTGVSWISSNGLETIGSSPEYLDPLAQREYLIDFITQNRDWELVNFFFVSGIYRCPFANTQILCDAVTSTCKSGIRSFDQFPAKPGCLVRVGLEETGFNI